MGDPLPRLGARLGEPGSPNDVVQPPLEQQHELFARVAFLVSHTIEQPAQLPLPKPIVVLDFCFCASARP